MVRERAGHAWTPGHAARGVLEAARDADSARERASARTEYQTLVVKWAHRNEGRALGMLACAAGSEERAREALARIGITLEPCGAAYLTGDRSCGRMSSWVCGACGGTRCHQHRHAQGRVSSCPGQAVPVGELEGSG